MGILVSAMDEFIHKPPKTELHIHIEGSLEPELVFEIGGRNGIVLPYRTVDEVRKAYEFSDLQSFLDIYYQGAQVLYHEQDFYELLDAEQQWGISSKLIFDNIRNHNLNKLLDLGLCVTVNSDDPACFGGYIEANYCAVQKALDLEREATYRLAHNAFKATFLDPERKQKLVDELDNYVRGFNG
jgi:adenosine deaminase